MIQYPYSSVQDFLSDVGRRDFEAALGVSTQVVSRAIAEDIMPAHWYFSARDFCRKRGKPVPENLFRRLSNGKVYPSKQSANKDADAALTVQGAPGSEGSS